MNLVELFFNDIVHVIYGFLRSSGCLLVLLMQQSYQALPLYLDQSNISCFSIGCSSAIPISVHTESSSNVLIYSSYLLLNRKLVIHLLYPYCILLSALFEISCPTKGTPALSMTYGTSKSCAISAKRFCNTVFHHYPLLHIHILVYHKQEK